MKKIIPFLLLVTLFTGCSKTIETSAIITDVPKTPDINSKVTMFITGDIHSGRGVEYRLNKNKRDGSFIFDKVKDILNEGDVVWGNIEDPITDSTDSFTGKIILKIPPSHLDAIKDAGFNVVNIANNHIMDYYEKGLFDTIELLDKNSIPHSGAGKTLDDARKPAYIENNNTKIGVLSYTEMAKEIFDGKEKRSFEATQTRGGVSPLVYESIKEDVEKLKKDVDIVFVSLHWGVEYEYAVSDYQIELAHKIIDELDVDGIIGTHPHRMKGIEMYKGKPIFYSLGNFISDQNDPKNQEGFFIKLIIEDKKISSISAIPFIIEEKQQIVPVYGDRASYLLNNQKTISEKLGTKCDLINDMLVYK